MLNWLKQFGIFIFFDSNEYETRHGKYECLLAVNPISAITGNKGDLLHNIYEWHLLHKDWMFGHICYDYKNIIETRLLSKHPERHAFPLLYFFCPQIVCYIGKEKNTLTIESLHVSPEDVFGAIVNAPEYIDNNLPSLFFSQRVNKPAYLRILERLKQHIEDGDCYEINFCNEAYCENIQIDTLQAFKKLNEISPAPFSAYYRLGDQYMMCASPERYLCKEGRKVLSQPIKGTARRDKNETEDERIKESLRKSIKDKAENVMIVDLMRNDLARSCEVGSVKVEELFGIYSFPQVHQMISTVSGEIKSAIPFTDAIRYSFPMGSMTGAPKIKVMELIEQYEQSRRELFSGTVGYITPDADFDFNVIIRSLFYNQTTRYLSYQTGGAITYDSDAQQEWEEMQLKASALKGIFS